MADSLWQTENSRLMCKERERERERERNIKVCGVGHSNKFRICCYSSFGTFITTLYLFPRPRHRSFGLGLEILASFNISAIITA